MDPEKEYSINKGTQILIGVPAQDPSPKMMKAIKDLLPHLQNVKEAYVFMKGVPPDKPVLTIGVYADKDEPNILKEIFSSIGRVIQPYLLDHENMDMIPLKGNMYEIVKKTPGVLIYSI